LFIYYENKNAYSLIKKVMYNNINKNDKPQYIDTEISTLSLIYPYTNNVPMVDAITEESFYADRSASRCEVCNMFCNLPVCNRPEYY